jgi:hypothetical protein
MKIYITLLFALVSIFTSCDKGDDWSAKRRIINNTSHSVDVEISADDTQFSYSIAASDTLEIEGTCSCCVPRICNIGLSQLEYGTIIFDDTLQLLFVGEPSSCEEKAINVDPYDECHGYTRTEEDGWIIYTYVITEEEYNNAEPID